MLRSALTAGAVLALAAGSAQAKLPASISIDIPPGGSATMTSPALPATATQASVTVRPVNDAMLRSLRTAFTTIRSKKARLLGCLIFSTARFAGTEVESIQAVDDALQALFLAACVELARTTPVETVARAAASGCSAAGLALPMTVTGSKGSFALRAEGPARNRRAPLTGRCRVMAGGVRITLRSRTRGVPIRRVVGSRLRMGVANTSTEVGGSVKTTFDAR